MTTQKHILLIQLRYEHQLDAFATEAETIAGPLKATPGLTWRMWIDNPDTKRPGAVCIFESADSLNAFLRGPNSKRIRNHRSFSKVKMRRYRPGSDANGQLN